METFVLITGAWHGGWSWRPDPGSHEANVTRPAELTDAFLRAVSA